MGILRQRYVYVYCFLLSVGAGCGSVRDLKDFTLYGKTLSVDPAKLKINGVYYNKSGGRVECFVLYHNGIYLELPGTRINSDVESAIESVLIHTKRYQKTFSTDISMWGAFEIVSDTLSIQQFHHPASSEVFFITVFNYSMKILNDTTLVRIGDYNMYHLYRTDNKPDSTNLFTTNKKIRKRLDKLYEKRNHQTSTESPATGL